MAASSDKLATMSKKAANQIAELLLAAHEGEEYFEIDFLDENFTVLLVSALSKLGCEVERLNHGSRLQVNCARHINKDASVSEK
jgi:hypothetical protein